MEAAIIAHWPLWLLALVLWNGLVFALYGYDKWCAKRRRRRLAESDLLFWAALAGSPGALLACRTFRHKTRKQPFAGRLWALFVAHVLITGALAGWHLAGPKEAAPCIKSLEGDGICP